MPDIIYACVHDLRFDRQLEISRDWYLAELVDLAGVREQAFEAIARTRLSNRSRDPMLDLLSNFGRRGHQGSRELLHTFAAKGEESAWICVCYMDGFEGFRWLVERELIGREEFFVPFCEAETYEGEETARRKLEAFAETNHLARELLERLTQIYNPQETKPGREVLHLSYELFQRELEGAETSHKKRFVGSRFSARADREALVLIAERLLSEPDPDAAWGCADVLQRHEFEGKAELLLSGSLDDPEKREAVVAALDETQHPLVRDAAVGWLSLDPPVFEALHLLILNYREGDETLLQELIVKANELGVYQLHSFCSDLEKVVKDGSPANSAELLRWAYEQTPCAFCREYIFAQLVERGFAERGLLEEAQYDCAEFTRNLAAEALAG